MSDARPFPNLIIRASAGAGKTFQLSNRFLELLHAGAAPDHLLATTFTRKAAGEILDRVMVRMAEAATGNALRNELQKHLDGPPLTQAACLEVLATAAGGLHRLRVSTLDSFFAQLARSYSLEVGLPPGWRIVDVLEDAQLRDEAVEAVLREHETRDLLTLINHLTKGEAARGVSELIRSTVNSLYDVWRETDSQAWHEIPRTKAPDDAQLSLLIEELRDVELPGSAFDRARNTDLELLAVQDWETLISKGIATKVLAGQSKFGRQEIPEHVRTIYERLLACARAVLVGRIANQTEGTYELLAKFHVHYRRLKLERRALRFEDVTRALLKLPDREDADAVAFRLDAGVDHLLLDEFQDTSLVQWNVVRPFAKRVTSPNPVTSFFCVGDVKQAIYGWRGGVAEIFDALTRQLPDLQPKTLDRSFRSSPVIMETVNRVFQGIGTHPRLDRERAGLDRWTQRFQEHSTAKTKLPGYACLETARAAAEGEEKTEPVIRLAAERVADIVARAPGRSVGVLVRRNATVGRLIHALRAAGVAASEEGGNPLTDSAAVQLVLSLLRLADHPGDTVARFHLAHSPLADISLVRSTREGHDEIGVPRLHVGLVSDTNEQSAVTVSQYVRRVLLTDGYGPAIDRWATALAPSCNRRELSRLKQLVELAYTYQAEATLRTDDFIRHVEHERVSDPTAADVRVMTVHQAKGLEFDVVVLPELEANIIGQPPSLVVDRESPTSPIRRVCRYVSADLRKLLPADFQRMFEAADDHEVSEALCVLYVALTRAIHALHMIVAPSPSSERNLRKSISGLLRAALTDGSPAPPEEVLFSHGDPDWYVAVKKAEPLPDAAEEEKPLQVRLAVGRGARRRGLERKSPSGLEGGRRVRLEAVFAGAARSGALDRGTLIHAWFESIAWLEDGQPDDDALRGVAANMTDLAVDVDSELPKFRAMLARGEIAAALSRSAYSSPESLGLPNDVQRELAVEPPRLEVFVERRFAVRDGNALLSGSIDRLVLIYREDQLLAADVIDFKTDFIDRNADRAIAGKVEFYRPQIEAYRRAVAAMTGLDAARITARLLFVSPGIVAKV